MTWSASDPPELSAYVFPLDPPGSGVMHRLDSATLDAAAAPDRAGFAVTWPVAPAGLATARLMPGAPSPVRTEMRLDDGEFVSQPTVTGSPTSPP